MLTYVSTDPSSFFVKMVFTWSWELGFRRVEVRCVMGLLNCFHGASSVLLSDGSVFFFLNFFFNVFPSCPSRVSKAHQVKKLHAYLWFHLMYIMGHWVPNVHTYHVGRYCTVRTTHLLHVSRVGAVELGGGISNL